MEPRGRILACDLDSDHVTDLAAGMSDGLLVLHILDAVQPTAVNWSKVRLYACQTCYTLAGLRCTSVARLEATMLAKLATLAILNLLAVLHLRYSTYLRLIKCL